MKTKPFCWAVGKEWTLRPSNTDLREIHTDLNWTRKHRKAHKTETTRLENITHLLDEKQLGDHGPVRILVEGNIFNEPLHILRQTKKVNVVQKQQTSHFKDISFFFVPNRSS